MNNIILIRKLNELKNRNEIKDIEFDRLIEMLQVEERSKDYFASEKKAVSALKKMLNSKAISTNVNMRVMFELDLQNEFEYKFQNQTLYACLNEHMIFAVTKKYVNLPYMYELTDVQLSDLGISRSTADGMKPFNVKSMLPTNFSEYKVHNYDVKNIVTDAKLTDKKSKKPYRLKDDDGNVLAGVNIFDLKGAIDVLQIDDTVELWIKDKCSPMYIVNDNGFALICPVII